jgi:hypothetical protein
VAGFIGDFRFDHGQRLVFSLVDLEDVTQGLHLQRQGLAEAVRGSGPVIEIRQTV